MRRLVSKALFSLVLSVLATMPALAEKRVALVIGNSAYTHATPLPNPRNDAQAIAKALKRLNFDVVSGLDLDWSGFNRVLKEFKKKLDGADVALLFYAGHGLQVKGQNYLIPVGAKLEDETDLRFNALELGTILKEIERRAVTKLVFLDACRDNPLARSLYRSMRKSGSTRSTGSVSSVRGLARVRTASGTMIAFATEPGEVARDGDKGKHSPFTTALLSHIETPNIDVAKMMRSVRKDVIKLTRQSQTPWTSSSLTDDFYFRKVIDKEKGVAKLVPDTSAQDWLFWKSIQNSSDPSLYTTYLSRFPSGTFAPIAKARLQDLQAAREKQAAKNQQAVKQVKEPATKTISQAVTNPPAESKKVAAVKAATNPDAATPATPDSATAIVPKRKKLAMLQPAEQSDTSPTATLPDQSTSAPAVSQKELASLLQKELKRVGCYVGAIDGQWGPGSRRALQRFTKLAHAKIPGEEPSLTIIDAVKAKRARICPIRCGAGTELKGGRCIATRKGSPKTQKSNSGRRSSSKRVAKKRPQQKKQAPQRGRQAPAQRSAPGPISVGVGIGGISF